MENVLEDVNCIFCGSENYQPVYSRIDARYFLDENIYTMNKCKSCGGYFLSPRIKEQFISNYYPNEFYSENLTHGEIWKQEFRKNTIKYELFLKKMRPGKLLDIGCRDGSFVKFMELFGWEAEGYEYNENIRNRFDCHIFYNNLYQFPENSYDLITLWAVLEHLYNPNDYIEYCQKLLKPGGLLIVQVPKFNSFTGKFLIHEDVPRHVSAFTSSGLINYIEKFGFDLEKIDTTNPIYYGSSYGFLSYCTSIVKGSSQSEALRVIYGGQMGEANTVFMKLDMCMSKYLDRVLRKMNYWGQMTGIFKKRFEGCAEKI